MICMDGVQDKLIRYSVWLESLHPLRLLSVITVWGWTTYEGQSAKRQRHCRPVDRHCRERQAQARSRTVPCPGSVGSFSSKGMDRQLFGTMKLQTQPRTRVNVTSSRSQCELAKCLFHSHIARRCPGLLSRCRTKERMWEISCFSSSSRTPSWAWRSKNGDQACWWRWQTMAVNHRNLFQGLQSSIPFIADHKAFSWYSHLSTRGHAAASVRCTENDHRSKKLLFWRANASWQFHCLFCVLLPSIASVVPSLV